ncbi:hypothetical protein [Streptomyces sp. NPDC055749]
MAASTASATTAAGASGSGAELFGASSASPAALGSATGLGTTSVLAFLAVRVGR